MSRRSSRPGRWLTACALIKEGLTDLGDLKDEYQDWLDGLPENLQQSLLAEKLEAVCDLDLDEIESLVDEAEMIDLPLGFGRD